MSMHWVKSHDEGDYNNEVDVYAGIAAMIIYYLTNDVGYCTCKGYVQHHQGAMTK